MTGQEKLNTCKFRSEEPHTVTQATCCGAKAVNGYLCYFHIDLDRVNADICEKCVYYQPKVSIKVNGES